MPFKGGCHLLLLRSAVENTCGMSVRNIGNIERRGQLANQLSVKRVGRWQMSGFRVFEFSSIHPTAFLACVDVASSKGPAPRQGLRKAGSLG